MDAVQVAISNMIQPYPLLLLTAGTILGVVVGAMPGLTGAMLISLTVPLTYSMANPADAMILLVSMYVGSISGGLISATLLRMPGTPASIMTTLDGFPMAQKGRPGRALGLGILASFVGGLISWGFLVLLARPVAEFSTRLGPFEMFSLVMMAMVLIASVSGDSLLRGVFSGMLGVMFTLPGTSPSTGQLRLTFGFSEMSAGFKLLPVLIGLFAVSQIITDTLHLNRRHEANAMDRRGIFLGLADWARHLVNMIRSSLIGTWVGILPGVGANIGSVMSYSAAKGVSKTPEEFGQGSEEGIVASESANNATVGGALIPLVAMGIPGSVIDAILLGALVLHGLQPGMLLFKENPEIVYTVMGSMLLANCVMFVFMIFSVGWIARLMAVPRPILLPVILVCCVVGSFALNNRTFDVGVMLAFGLLGFAMDRFRIPLAPFVIGFVLAPVAERNLGTGLQSSDGSIGPMLTSPIAAGFLVASILILAGTTYSHWKRLRRPTK